ncbi:MAG: hypothetical protein ACHP9T_08755 [Caulobacterales bacterium]
MMGFRRQIKARSALRAVLAAGLLLMLGANLPGHLSYDSVAQLYEGHFHVRNTWGPALYAWVLGAFDAVIPGTALYVTVSGLLFYASLASLADLRPRTSWLAVAAAAAVVLIPQVLIYQAIVWKDVMFANCAVAGLICVAHAARAWPNARRRWLYLACALVLLAAGSQVRQNGIIAAVLAAVALGWIASQERWRRGVAWGLGGFVAVVMTGAAMTALSFPPHGSRDTGVSTGIRIVQNYDLIGAVAMDPHYPLDLMAASDPAAAQVIRQRARFDYSGRRVDFVDRDQAMGDAFNAVSDPAAQAQWFDLIFRHPALYLRVRLEDFRWLVAPPVIDWCLPVYLGVDAPADKMAPLKLSQRYVQSDVQLNNYATWFFDTPVYRHGLYLAISAVLAGLLLWRRQPADIAIAALQLGGLAFAASFFIISIACDYRYLYFSDLAAIAGLIYAAVDPPTPWRKAG